jgi:hypothetical protein
MDTMMATVELTGPSTSGVTAPQVGLRSKSERHEAAVRRSLSWAHDDARAGDYAGALSWLDMIEAMDGTLPAGSETTRRRWTERLGARGLPG